MTQHGFEHIIPIGDGQWSMSQWANDEMRQWVNDVAPLAHWRIPSLPHCPITEWASEMNPA